MRSCRDLRRSGTPIPRAIVGRGSPNLCGEAHRIIVQIAAENPSYRKYPYADDSIGLARLLESFHPRATADFVHGPLGVGVKSLLIE
jgi:hypothetical protein